MFLPTILPTGILFLIFGGRNGSSPKIRTAHGNLLRWLGVCLLILFAGSTATLAVTMVVHAITLGTSTSPVTTTLNYILAALIFSFSVCVSALTSEIARIPRSHFNAAPRTLKTTGANILRWLVVIGLSGIMVTFLLGAVSILEYVLWPRSYAYRDAQIRVIHLICTEALTGVALLALGGILHFTRGVRAKGSTR